MQMTGCCSQRECLVVSSKQHRGCQPASTPLACMLHLHEVCCTSACGSRCERKKKNCQRPCRDQDCEAAKHVQNFYIRALQGNRPATHFHWLYMPGCTCQAMALASVYILCWDVLQSLAMWFHEFVSIWQVRLRWSVEASWPSNFCINIKKSFIKQYGACAFS